MLESFSEYAALLVSARVISLQAGESLYHWASSLRDTIFA